MNINNIFKRLNIAEQMQLNNYINNEITKAKLSMREQLEAYAIERENAITETNNKSWEKISAWSDVAMREAGISRQRCDNIGRRIIDIANENKQEEKGEKLLINRLYKKYAVLTEEELRILIEWSLETKCKNCCGKTNCEVRALYKQFNIPEFNAEKYCEYAYRKNKIGKVL